MTGDWSDEVGCCEYILILEIIQLSQLFSNGFHKFSKACLSYASDMNTVNIVEYCSDNY